MFKLFLFLGVVENLRSENPLKLIFKKMADRGKKELHLIEAMDREDAENESKPFDLSDIEIP